MKLKGMRTFEEIKEFEGHSYGPSIAIEFEDDEGRESVASFHLPLGKEVDVLEATFNEIIANFRK